MLKKNIFKKTLAFVTSLTLGAISFTAVSLSADTAKYSRDYSIQNVLTDFQYFIKGNFNGSGHVVGAVAVGGTFDKTNTICDGQVTPSYIGDVKNATVGTANYYDGDKTVYYGTNSSDGDLPANFVQNTDYINMESAFADLSVQSKAIAQSGKVVSESSFNTETFYGANTLNIDVTDENITIPWSVFSNTDVINLVGYDNADYFKENAVFISVSDVPEGETVNLSTAYGTSGKNGSVNIFWNGQSSENYLFLSMSGYGTDTTETREINLEGMKLVWNIPDAETVNAFGLGGHLVAPNADVTLGPSGRFEGGIVAKELVSDGDAEALFYTYGTPTESGELAESIILEKSYESTVLSELSETERNDLLSSTEFTLYNNEACTDVFGTVSPIWNEYQNNASVVFSGEFLELNTTYYLKETNSPNDFLTSEYTFVCKINSDGTVSYKTSDQSDDYFTPDFPVCNNELVTTATTTTTTVTTTTTTPVTTTTENLTTTTTTPLTTTKASTTTTTTPLTTVTTTTTTPATTTTTKASTTTTTTPLTTVTTTTTTPAATTTTTKASTTTTTTSLTTVTTTTTTAATTTTENLTTTTTTSLTTVTTTTTTAATTTTELLTTTDSTGVEGSDVDVTTTTTESLTTTDTSTAVTTTSETLTTTDSTGVEGSNVTVTSTVTLTTTNSTTTVKPLITTTSKNNSSSPKTGDSIQIVIALAAISISAAALTKKRNKKIK